MHSRRGVRDIQVRYMAEEQARAQVDSILKIISVLEEKNLSLSDEEIAKMAGVSITQVSLIRNAFAKRNTTVADGDFMRDIVDEIKKEVREAVKSEIVMGFVDVSARETKAESAVIDEPVEEKRPEITSSVADVFKTASNVKMTDTSTSSGGKVSEQLDKLRKLREKKD